MIQTRWVLRWKGDDVKARLVAKGYDQDTTDQETYASTPLLLSFKAAILFAILRGWKVLFGDISTAFLHADLPEGDYIYVEPPKEY